VKKGTKEKRGLHPGHIDREGGSFGGGKMRGRGESWRCHRTEESGGVWKRPVPMCIGGNFLGSEEGFGSQAGLGSVLERKWENVTVVE